ncbi:MAG: LysR family transcriptional regulator [Firmicutes bacterium]|nr:LysR family transcriptional regulator [Bacillota bacterium]
MKLHQIEYFLAVEKYRSFSQAAMEINISQSTLSQQIASLEDELGVFLFVRHKRQVYLSRPGQEFLVYARNIVTEVEKAKQAMQQYATLNKGFLRLGIVPSFIYLKFENLIKKFIAEHKKIEVRLHIDTADNLLVEIRGRRIHLAFVSAPFPRQFDVSFYPIIDEQVVALLPADHPLAARKNLAIKDLKGQNLLRLKFNSSINKIIDDVLKRNETELNIILESDNADLIRRCVANGLGLSLLGDKLAEALLVPGTKIVPLQEQITVQNGLAVPTGHAGRGTLPQMTKLFRDFVLKEITS